MSIVVLAATAIPAYARFDRIKGMPYIRSRCYKMQRDTLVRDFSTQRLIWISVPEAPDTVKFDSLQTTITTKDTVLHGTWLRDSLRTKAPAVGVNLAWAGISAPNLSIEFPVGDNLSVGFTGAFKPWRRWNPFDWDEEATQKWAHLAVLPYVRWWPKALFDGFFVETALIYSHYNVADIKLPFGLYPDIADHRLQGDFYGGGLSIGCSFWLTRHLNLTLAAGALLGYKDAVKYECPWCGGEVGRPRGAEVAPRLDVSVAYHLFDQKRHEEKKKR